MTRDLRKHVRKSAKGRAYLYSADGWPLGECEMTDVSEGGARLFHKIADGVPEQLILSLSRNGQVRRLCKVAWKKEKQIGVRFVAGACAAETNKLEGECPSS